MASLANSQLAWANFISLPEGFARPAKWQDVTPIRAPALDSNGIERTPPNPALSEKLKNGTQSSSVVTSEMRIGSCTRAARAQIVPDVMTFPQIDREGPTQIRVAQRHAAV